MSCPSCQVGGRRLPSLPLGYTTKARKQMKSRNMNNTMNNTTILGSKSFSVGGMPQSLHCPHSPPLEDHVGMVEYLLVHPNVVEEYIMQHVSQSEIEKWLIRKSLKKDSRAPSAVAGINKGVSTWKFCVHKDKRQLLAKLTNDIHAGKTKNDVINELVKSIADGIHSTRHTFYSVDDTGKYLFPYSGDPTSMQNPLKQDIASARTVAGFVARTKEPMFAMDLLVDERFPAGTGITGTDLSILCYPILQNNGSLFGIVEFVRDENTLPFENEDIEIASSYMSWCEITIRYAEVAAQINSHANIEKFIHEFGLGLVERKKSTQDMLLFLMNFAMETIGFEHYTVYLLDTQENKLYSTITNFASENSDKMPYLKFPVDQGIAGYVLEKNCILNERDPYSNSNFSRSIDQKTGITTKTILAAPFGKDERSKGVMEFTNKINGTFNDHDEKIINLCKTYCNFVLLFKDFSYESFYMETQVGALNDALMYQQKPTKKQLNDIQHPLIPVDIPDNFCSLSFNMYIHADQFESWFIKIARDVFDRCQMTFCERVLVKFTANLRNFYHDFSYHNWEHAFSVAQFIYVLTESVWDKFEPLERIGMLVAAICHDIDHRGVNNAFLLKTNHPLAQLYSVGSVMEYHHSYMADLLLDQEDCDILYSLDKKDRQETKSFITKMILSTDLYTHFARKEKMQRIIGPGSFDWSNDVHRHMIAMMMMTLSDLCGSMKPWEIHRLSATKVFEEFFAQGDRELQLGFEPLQMFVKREDFPINQVGFLNGIVKPAVDLLESTIPALQSVQSDIAYNLARWEEIIAANEAADDALSTAEKKIAELRIPNSEMQKRSLSFVMYNCSGKRREGTPKGSRRRSSLPDWI